jgi:hypothetical protein
MATETDTEITAPSGDVVETVLAELQSQLAALDPDGMKREADAAVARVQQQASALEAKITTIQQARAAFAYLGPQSESVTFCRDTMRHARTTCCDELLAMPRRLYSDIDIGRRRNLELSIRSIDFGLSLADGFSLETLRVGQLLKAAGFPESTKIENQISGQIQWPGSLPEIEKRLRALQAQWDDAQHRLNDALLSDAARAAQATAIAERNRQPQRKTRGDGSQYDVFPDGRIVEVTTS